MTKNGTTTASAVDYDGWEWVLKRHASGKTSVYHQGQELPDASDVQPPAAVDALVRRATLIGGALEVLIHDERENSHQTMWVSKNGPYSSLDASSDMNHEAFKPPIKHKQVPPKPLPNLVPSGQDVESFFRKTQAAKRGTRAVPEPSRRWRGAAVAASTFGIALVAFIAIFASGSSGMADDNRALVRPVNSGQEKPAPPTDAGQSVVQKPVESGGSSKPSLESRAGSISENLRALEEEFMALLPKVDDLPLGAGAPIGDEKGDPILPTDPDYPSMKSNITEHPQPTTTETGPQAERIEVTTESDVGAVGIIVFAYGPSNDYGSKGPRPEVFLSGPDVESQQVFMKAPGQVLSGEYVTFFGIGEVPSGFYDFTVTYDGHTTTGKVQAY